MARLNWLAFASVIVSVVSFSATAFADDPPAPGTFEIPGANTTLRLSGFAQLDVTYDLKGRNPRASGDDYALIASIIPLNNSYEVRKKSGQLYMTVRTSRVGFSTETRAAFADIETKIEADFWSGNLLSSQTFTNSVLFRLRHGYGTLSGKYGSLLVGQTWSTLMSLAATAETVDFNGPGSGTGLRHPQIRYVIPIVGQTNIALAAENAPGTDQNGITDAPATRVPQTRKLQTVPDLVAKVSTAGSWGSASLGAVTVHYRDSGTLDQSSYSKQGWGVSAAGSLNIFKDTFRAIFTGGRGIGRYIFNAGGDQGVTNTGDRMVLWDAVGYHFNYTRVWNPYFRSNLVWSQTLFKNNGASSAAAPYEARIDPTTGDIIDSFVNQRIEELYVNTFWAPNRQVEFGVEYAFGQRHTFGNDQAPEPCVPGVLCASQTGTLHRVTTSARFNLF